MKRRKLQLDKPDVALMDAVVRVAAKSGIESESTRTIVAEAEGIGTDVI